MLRITFYSNLDERYVEQKSVIMHADTVVPLFLYTPAEQATFPYLRVYVRNIQPHIPQVITTPVACERFMLAGLFLTYRSYNHQNIQMTTNPDLLCGERIHEQRLLTFSALTGKAINDTSHYLQMITFHPLKMVPLGPGHMLYRFVRYGG